MPVSCRTILQPQPEDERTAGWQMKIWKCWFQKNTTFDDIWCFISWIQFIIISPTGELPWLPSPLGLDAGSSELLMSSVLFFTCKVRNPWNPCITRLEPVGLIINHNLSSILRIKIAILGGIPMFKHPNAHVELNLENCPTVQSSAHVSWWFAP